ncbi:MAG: galactosyldiacylglycerol synthase [Betaproteobacteria bacterium]|nr:galactosyldiacylglycerol synthase [Betaproteobacteria bacterium]
MPTVDLVYFNAGGGHRASALALQQAIADRGLGWTVRLVNLTEVLDPQGSFRKFGLSPEDYYNARLARGLTLGLHTELRLLQALIRLLHPTLLKVLGQHWLRTRPDMVVSLIPNFNRALFESLACSLPGVPYVTVLTDLADHPPHFWIEPGQDQHLICGTPKAVEQARQAGFDERRIHATSGMVIRPDFYRRAPALDAAAHGLDPAQPTGVVMFGGHGSRSMVAIAQRLPDVQLVLMCGHNGALAAKLRALPAAAPRVILGFTTDVADFMRLGDFFIGKPGPGSLSEALHLGLPAIVTRNVWTMPQERYNTQWLAEEGLGLVLPSFRGIRAAVHHITQQLGQYQRRVRARRNRAVYEIPAILAQILQTAARERKANLPPSFDSALTPCVTSTVLEGGEA